MVRIVVIPGSAREASVNRRLARHAADAARGMGAEVSLIDPREHRLPLFDQDLEEAEGLPAAARAVKRELVAAQGVIFCSPEYNSSVTPLMKNLIDWASRRADGDEAPLAAFRGKVAGLLAASPGAWGGLRGLVHLRSILGNLGMLVVPQQFALAEAYDKFGDDGSLVDDKARGQVEAVVRQVVETAGKLAG